VTACFAVAGLSGTSMAGLDCIVLVAGTEGVRGELLRISCPGQSAADTGILGETSESFCQQCKTKIELMLQLIERAKRVQIPGEMRTRRKPIAADLWARLPRRRRHLCRHRRGAQAPRAVATRPAWPQGAHGRRPKSVRDGLPAGPHGARRAMGGGLIQELSLGRHPVSIMWPRVGHERRQQCRRPKP
jgi:hypothetical protein